jgi:uncharacterized protein YciI
MFIVLLKFSTNKSQAAQHMEGHKAWLQRGYDEGVFLLSGSLTSVGGGAILAHGSSLADLQSRVEEDPFVAAQVVSAEIIEVAPSKAQDSLAFLIS